MFVINTIILVGWLTDMETLISLHGVSLSFERRIKFLSSPQYFPALEDIDLEVFRGETLGIIGNNGSGKSTLLRVLAGIYKPDSGTVTNTGVTASLLALQAGFDFNLSGADNAVLLGLFHGYSRLEMEKQFSYLEEETGLGEFFYEPVRTYSDGMRARLGFAVSVLLKPEILLLDEVLAVGDQEFREKAEQMMRNRLRSDQTAVLVSHSLAQIERLCDRAILLSSGRCVAVGDVKTVISKYDTSE